MNNVIISNFEKFDQLKKKFIADGKDKIHVLADFDRTLTKYFVNGEKRPAIQGVLRDGNYLTPDYAPKAQALFEKYYPTEVDPNIPFEEKKAKMLEWWQLANDLMIESGLQKKDIEAVIKSGKVVFRDGALVFFEKLHKNNIPMIILSAGGLGKDSMSMLLKQNNSLYNNIFIIGNSFEFDEQGKAIKVNEPIIHVMNKDETVIKDFPEVFDQVKERKNVILLGDNIEDLEMITGFDYDNLLKIGFLNDDVEKNLENYKNYFDVVIVNDGDMDFLNGILKEII